MFYNYKLLVGHIFANDGGLFVPFWFNIVKECQIKTIFSISDVTLNDFANTTVIKFRKKKSTSNLDSVLTEINEGEQTSWNEEEHQYEDDFIDEMVQNDETILSSDAQNIIYNVYPIDIWYIISDYIRQEDICRFALICKATLEVVSSVKFWTRLYQRYYSPRKKLPKDLQPEQVLGRKYGLRTGVIRALGFLNPKYEHNMSFCIVNLKKLKNRICDCLWHRQINKSQWCFLFKLREKITTHSYSRRNDKHPDSLEMLDDISANPDKHYKILKIFCEQFIHVPPVLGKYWMWRLAWPMSVNNLRFQIVDLGIIIVHFHENGWATTGKFKLLKRKASWSQRKVLSVKPVVFFFMKFNFFFT